MNKQHGDLLQIYGLCGVPIFLAGYVTGMIPRMEAGAMSIGVGMGLFCVQVARWMGQRRASMVSLEHIEIRPGICGGKPRIADHGILVANIVAWHEQTGMSVRQIVETCDGITPADLHAALAYYHGHQDAIDTQMRADKEFVAEMKSRIIPSRFDQNQ